MTQQTGSRSTERGLAAINKIKSKLPDAKLSCVELDLDSLDAVVKCAAAVRTLTPVIHALVLNAG